MSFKGGNMRKMRGKVKERETRTHARTEGGAMKQGHSRRGYALETKQSNSQRE